LETRFDDRDEMVCAEDCFYADAEFEAGESVLLSDHPAVRRMPECFEALTAENAPKRKRTLREELELRAQRIDELDRIAVRETMRKQTRGAQRSEAALWRDVDELIAAADRESSPLEDLPDPAREAEEERLLEERRIAALLDPSDERFWHETEALVERVDGAADLALLRELDGE
jgi:hypothetical protein